jgi:hypothetical protein
MIIPLESIEAPVFTRLLPRYQRARLRALRRK